jgi:hypothetical protein
MRTTVARWASIDRMTKVAELGFKLAATAVALLAINVFFFEPRLDLSSFDQTFIDMDTLSESYRGEVPPVVERTAEEYNDQNARDLAAGSNSSQDDVPSSALCADQPGVVEAVFPDYDCTETEDEVGRGRFYERSILDLNARAADPLDTAGLRRAIQAFQDAEYRRARTSVENEGRRRASSIVIIAADGYFREEQEVDLPFTLDVDDPPVERTFRTRVGEQVRMPSSSGRRRRRGAALRPRLGS